MQQLRIAIDLESEQPYTRNDTTDSKLSEATIIQVGWVVFDCDTNEVKERFLEHINVGVPISSFIKKLTGIKDVDIEKGLTLKEVYGKLKISREKWIASRRILEWGSGDMKAIQNELNNPNDWPFGYSGQNVKHLYQTFAEANGMNISGGLKKSMSKCGLLFNGRAHNALVDAENTATMYSFLYNQFKLAKKG